MAAILNSVVGIIVAIIVAIIGLYVIFVLIQALFLSH